MIILNYSIKKYRVCINNLKLITSKILQITSINYGLNNNLFLLYNLNQIIKIKVKS